MRAFLTQKCIPVLLVACFLALSGCATIPMASKELDAQAKTYAPLPENKAGLYIYRNTFVGQALKKLVKLDGQPVGETANKTYFYRDIEPGPHTLATESEFSDNLLEFTAEGGKYYYARQYIKMGVFVGGANIEMVEAEEAKREISECMLAK